MLDGHAGEHRAGHDALTDRARGRRRIEGTAQTRAGATRDAVFDHSSREHAAAVARRRGRAARVAGILPPSRRNRRADRLRRGQGALASGRAAPPRAAQAVGRGRGGWGMIVGLLSDTHGKLRRAIFELFRGVDLILHAGDVGPLDIITELETIAPVHAVLGNTDSWELVPQLQEMLDLELEGRRVVVMHGHQLGSPAPRALRVAHAGAHVIVYGHTHRQHVERSGGTRVVNRGAAGPARFNLKPAVANLTLAAASAPAVELLPTEE